MALDLLSRLNPSNHLASTILRSLSRGDSIALLGSHDSSPLISATSAFAIVPDSNENFNYDDEIEKLLSFSNLMKNITADDTTEISSMAADDMAAQFEISLRRIARYRQTLFDEVKASAAGVESDKLRFELIANDLAESIDQSKARIASLHERLAECERLHDVNRPALRRLIECEQQYKLYELLRSSADARRSLESIYDSIAAKREYRSGKISLDTILMNVGALRRSYHTIAQNLNVLLRADSDSIRALPLYDHFMSIAEEWKRKLSELIEELFIWSFDGVGWPIISLEDMSPERARGDKQRTLFLDLFRFALELQTGDFRLEGKPIDDNRLAGLSFFTETADVEFHAPITMMTIPLTKRFNYYFVSTANKLNNIENPEWFLCQVEQWITRNESFLRNTIDPILDEYFDGHCKTSKFQLTCHLLELVKTKLRHDAPRLVDDRLFSLTLDEVIIFNKQLDFIVPGIFESNAELNPIRVFFDDPIYFERFLALEKSRLNEFVESIFESETSWNTLYGTDSSEDNRFVICEAADKFSLLLQNLIERSTFIPSNAYRIRIIDLIIDIIDDFRLRLSQLIHVYEERWPFSKKFYAILNTFDFFVALINDWQNNSYFMQILHENDRDALSFQTLAKTFEHMIEEIFNRIENTIIAEVTRDIIEYKKLNWHSMSLPENEPLVTSKAGATLIYNISTKSSAIKRHISSNLFHTFLYDIARKIQDLFFDRIVMEHDFNKDGAQQLQHDIVMGVFSIFALHIKHTEHTFAKLSDALVILNCSSQTCHDLQSRHRSCNEIEFKMALRNIGVYSLKPRTVMAVIEKRIGFN